MVKENVSFIEPEVNIKRPFNVYFLDGKMQSTQDQLHRYPGIKCYGWDKTTPEKAEQLLIRPDANEDPEVPHAVVIRSATRFSGKYAQVLEKANTLQLIVRAGIGVDNIDLETAAKEGIMVENTPIGNIGAVVTKTMDDIETAMSKSIKTTMAVQRGDYSKTSWNEKENPYEKHIFGVIGLGNIGTKIVEQLKTKGKDINILGYDPYKQLDGISNVSLEELCSQADIITVHAALSDSSNDMIGTKELENMKPGVVIINNARGGIVNERALLEAKKSGKVGAVFSDVFTVEGEGLKPGSSKFESLSQDQKTHVIEVLLPLIKEPLAFSSMHVAANSLEAQAKNSTDVVKQIIDFAYIKGLHNGASFPAVALPTNSIEADTIYRMLVLNKNVPGVHGNIREVISAHDYGYNIEAVTSFPSADGKRSAMIQAFTFRAEKDQSLIEALEPDIAKQIIASILKVDHVLKARMVRVDRDKK